MRAFAIFIGLIICYHWSLAQNQPKPFPKPSPPQQSIQAQSLDLPKVINEYSQLLEREPQNSKAHLKRGNAYFGLGQYELSMQDMDKVLEIDPENSDALSYRGVAKILSGNKDGGCLDLLQAQNLGNLKGSDVYLNFCQ